jgi:hypothetical protein
MALIGGSDFFHNVFMRYDSRQSYENCLSRTLKAAAMASKKLAGFASFGKKIIGIGKNYRLRVFEIWS